MDSPECKLLSVPVQPMTASSSAETLTGKILCFIIEAKLFAIPSNFRSCFLLIKKAALDFNNY